MARVELHRSANPPIDTRGSLVTEMAELWDLEELGGGRFVARPPGEGPLFGGLTMALLLRSAAETAPDPDTEPSRRMRPKSLHTSFFRGGQWGRPLELEVERVNDGRSFAHRLVTMRQEGSVLAQGSISLHRPDGNAPDEQTTMPPPVPGPDALESVDARLTAAPGIFEVRPVAGPGEAGWFSKIHPYWARPRGGCPDDPLAGECVLTFISDYMVIGASHPEPVPQLEDTVLTVSHDLWYHRRATPGGWLRYDASVTTRTEGRYLATGTVHDLEGRLIATFVQEVLRRPRQ